MTDKMTDPKFYSHLVRIGSFMGVPVWLGHMRIAKGKAFTTAYIRIGKGRPVRHVAEVLAITADWYEERLRKWLDEKGLGHLASWEPIDPELFPEEVDVWSTNKA